MYIDTLFYNIKKLNISYIVVYITYLKSIIIIYYYLHHVRIYKSMCFRISAGIKYN